MESNELFYNNHLLNQNYCIKYIFIIFRNKGEVDIEPSSEELVGNKYREPSTPKKNFLFNYVTFTEHANLKGKNNL